MRKHIPTLHLYIKLFDKNFFEYFSNYIPINITPAFLNEEDIDLVIEETVEDKEFKILDKERETCGRTEELKFPREYDSGQLIDSNFDDLNEKENSDPRVQARFKRSRHNNKSVFIISQGYYQLPIKTVRANGNIYHIFKHNNFRDVQNPFPDKASMDMTFNELKYLISTCWDKKYQSLTIGMTNVKHTGRYRLGLNSFFTPEKNPF